MFADIRILTQYRENYGDESNPRWKMKGGIEFLVKGVDDVVMYVPKAEMDAAIGRILAKQSSSQCSYELISWEFIFGDPHIVDKETLMSEIESAYQF
jgi:hypothetical protein